MTTPAPTLALVRVPLATADERAAFRDQRLADVAAFLHRHLGRYGDPLEHVRAALLRAAGDGPRDGGSVTLAEIDGELVGAVVTNATHMSGYTPEHLLVYVATHEEHRGQGIGRTLLRHAVEELPGSVALHVEPDNPAVGLYRALGFTNKYLEMRLQR
jgi:ribosomal protein S18 acetylase RimI-like enzyme